MRLLAGVGAQISLMPFGDQPRAVLSPERDAPETALSLLGGGEMWLCWGGELLAMGCSVIVMRLWLTSD